MKWIVKPMKAGLRVDFDRVRGTERLALIEALKLRQDDWRGCTSDQRKNIATSMISSVGYTVTLYVVAKDSARLDSRKITKYLDSTIEREGGDRFRLPGDQRAAPP